MKTRDLDAISVSSSRWDDDDDAAEEEERGEAKFNDTTRIYLDLC